MDLLNDYYPLCQANPDTSELSDSELSEREEYIRTLTKRSGNRKLTFDDWNIKYSDDLWYMWCNLKEYTEGTKLLNKMEYHSFCSMVYENSSKN